MRNARSIQPTGAKGIVSGFVSTGATWIEQFEISLNNLPIADADTSVWKFVFKHCNNGSIRLTLTSGAEMTVTQGPISTIFAINTPISSRLCGDFHADLGQQLAGGSVIHWVNGVLTFIPENLGF